MKPFYHTLYGDPVDAGLEPVNEGDFWITEKCPYIRENGKWVETENDEVWTFWFAIFLNF